MEEDRQHQEKKKVYNHVMRAKLFGVIAINTIEGITSEIDNLLPYEMEKDNVDALSEQYRKYHNGVLYPTSYADQMDRAVKSLGKDLGIAITVDLVNTQAVKKVLTKFIRASAETDRRAIVEWLSQPNEVIMKSERFEDLINRCCLQFYKKTTHETSDDNLSFIRRSANELLRNKASKEAMKKRILSNDYRYDEDDMDVSQHMYGVHSGITDGHIMIVDQNVMNQPVPLPSYEGLPMNHMMSISPMNGIPLSTYDGIAQIQHIGQTQNNANVSMSIPVNNMSVNVNMNGINPINLSALPAMSVNTINGLQLPVGIQPVNLGVIDNQRNFNNVNSSIEMPITRSVPEDSEERATGA